MPPPDQMTAAELAEAKALMFWTTAGIGRLAGVPARKATRWLHGKAAIPPAIAAHVRAVLVLHRDNPRPTAEDDTAAQMPDTELFAACKVIGWDARALIRQYGYIWRAGATIQPPLSGFIRSLAAWHATNPWPAPPPDDLSKRRNADGR